MNLTPNRSSASLLWLGKLTWLSSPGTDWVSQVLIISLYTCHVLKHRQILQNLTNAILLSRLPLTPQRRHLHSQSIDAKTTSGMCIFPVTYIVLCVRFASFVHVCRSQNRLQRSAGYATLDTVGWLGLMNSFL